MECWLFSVTLPGIEPKSVSGPTRNLVTILVKIFDTYKHLTLWGPTSSYARQCVPLHEVQRRGGLDTLYCYAFCRFQEAHAICYVLYELLGG